YAKRTIVSGWDTQFNCITGLNGSGKSNILDAICFVLGITTLSTVRASNQKDLIYKRGQAGVTTASVCIVFDNTDPDNQPLGYEGTRIISVTRQVIMGGTTKYLINGHKTQQSQVQALFQSVHLNVNNPNFLIMQGQITKVVNMKPIEILGLIEEAAGTGMYEKERKRAVKEINDRDAPLQETELLLNEEVRPKLERLRAQKRDFLEYQQRASSTEELEKVVGGSIYLVEVEKLQTLQSEASTNDAQAEELRAQIEAKNQNIIKEAEDAIKRLTDKWPWCTTINLSDPKSGRELEELSKKLSIEKKKISSLESKVDSSVVSMIGRLESDEDSLRQRLATIREDRRKLQESMEVLNEKRTDTINAVWQSVSDNFGEIFGDLLPVNMAPWAHKKLHDDAVVACDLLNDTVRDRFEVLFLRNIGNDKTTFDYNLEITMADAVNQTECVDNCFKILDKTWSERYRNMRIEVVGCDETSWSLASGNPSVEKPKLLVHVNVNPEVSEKKLSFLTPEFDSIDDFKDFWGSKASL
ncbi:Structural maintenance of chromosomes protein 2, partial [Lucilia cuprina]